MRLFSAFYDKILGWAQHRHAPIYLACLSFTEASFFPIPPDLMLAPMAIAQPKQAWWFATLTTLSSVLGGIFGYIIGMFFIVLIEPWIIRVGYLETYTHVQHWFDIWGFWALLLAGFTPIPYKLFTIAGGAVGMPILPFIMASLIGRGSRFYLVSGLVILCGEKVRTSIRYYIDWIGWIFLILVFCLFTLFYYR